MASNKTDSSSLHTRMVVLLAGILAVQVWSAFGGGQTAPAAPVAVAPTAAPTPTPTPAPQPAAPATVLAAADLEAVLDTIPYDGSEDADIVILEYSSVPCPFCKRHHNAGTLKSVQEQFGEDKVAISFRHFPLSTQAQAMPAAIGAECVKKIGGEEAFFTFVDEVFTVSNLSDAGYLAAATTAGVDTAAWQSCYDAKETQQEVSAQQAEGSGRFGVRGTPGNVVLNTKTGDWELVSGAQQAPAFEAAVNRLLAK